jgi:hypothetical protein
MHKLEVMKEKLDGKNAADIMMKELRKSTHTDKDYLQQLKKALVGRKKGIRYRILEDKMRERSSANKKFLEVDEQVDFLIDMARDSDLLGRIWIGWAPYL